MRGARSLSGFPHRGTRIIPADAGSTMEHTLDVGLVGDHPRGCGEHHRVKYGAPEEEGSSPRMRGALTILIIPQNPVGIIPADAGSTAIRLPVRQSEWDHPRGCGEHRARRIPLLQREGSSPRMRGALNGDLLPHVAVRIIPADAGSTTCLSSLLRYRQDHPRGCGEHSARSKLGNPVNGSSPRMRGAPPVGLPGDGPPGIIPADAGSTDAYAKAHWERQDHPRGCGEHFLPAHDFSLSWGSSPRMRGAQLHVWLGET